MMFWGYSYGWPMIFGGLFCTLLLILGLWILIRWLSRATASDARLHTSSSEPSAMEILRRRYARGEIDAMTFEQTRERLEAGHEHQSVGDG